MCTDQSEGNESARIYYEVFIYIYLFLDLLVYWQMCLGLYDVFVFTCVFVHLYTCVCYTVPANECRFRESTQCSTH